MFRNISKNQENRWKVFDEATKVKGLGQGKFTLSKGEGCNMFSQNVSREN